MPARVPTEADFTSLSSILPLTLTWPQPAELTTSFLILFHGLGDSETPFASFAKNMSLPGVLCISVRGTSPLPAALLGTEPGMATGSGSGSGGGGDGGHYFHWGDDIKVDPSTDELDPDPGFTRARDVVLDRLVRHVLLERCGWTTDDVMLFGFGQGGSLALGLAAALRAGPRVVDVSASTGAASAGKDEDEDEDKDKDKEKKNEKGRKFKGVVSIGGPLPPSLVPSMGSSSRTKSRTPVLVCQLDEEESDAVREEFAQVEVVRWPREVAMPRDRVEMFPIMKFFAERLKAGW
ncbi:hypothetical protein SODALDRAFT_332710 [Sodiomyces alkalinus F11]|uniref:Alpha/beta-hydrolase n=1 Tax=Sodiomyces alkalinus (strain CBS 110278 / VKM F-3762 / F11) TaxID=1314773 RepID=A0A3N2PXP6_SODAK|nr:hypothetical protein SODALDRAFT_332710 [Sodiomyces alkalinus F11]ROT39267.1 hypothetical protein SODALDRAFT_332710 [Sodiomyces alkalinus F11]